MSWMDDSFPNTEAWEMKIRYLIVDAQQQLSFIARDQVEAVCRGNLHVSELGCGDLSEMRIISVVSDPERLLPKRIYLMRMSLTDGYFTRRNYRTLRSFTMREHVTLREAFHHHS